MKMRMILAVSCGLAFCAIRASAASEEKTPEDYQTVLTTLGKKGDYKDKVLKVNVPRNDLKVTVNGVATPTPFGFGGWIAMTKGDRDMDVMMGDLVLLEDEVNPVMTALLDHGLEVTALHNHFFWEQPRIFYLHVHGHGKSQELAQQVKPALDLIGHVSQSQASTLTPTGSTRESAVDVEKGTLNTEQLEKTIGHKGETTGKVTKFTIGRDDLHVREMGATINTRMGLNTWAAFVGSDENAAVAGDVAMLESEVNPVLKALRGHDLKVVAIHQHMFGTQPEIIFLHYWGTGPAAKLADGFKAALNELGKSQSRASHGRSEANEQR